jgi:hypothetical protein
MPDRPICPIWDEMDEIRGLDRCRREVQTRSTLSINSPKIAAGSRLKGRL